MLTGPERAVEEAVASRQWHEWRTLEPRQL